ncbi:ATP:cob(I)alamin adenosyltransferase [Candidatus Woesebacteria bacterium RBG_16_36_11]|uniref:Corrinoid adenosyltransferase n=3 Tax=Candidatus Woeseibacteriota TaxID=1752722 RepID=A0A1F7X7R1_9BACT|nr:MAG: ATP:cob(I)alamin adenosyltransferase [Candidatus Woesebacteria bacterium RBG_13_36_22]OGM11100.1 MAG: ATP:cob(I)alamin adenosyltransferase [Candidatus Woesebacteria bacterium RBG_16_36_11]OGM17161.1 MAG: ATP:cob(I)alamin adenosyltransferase [Candidatus Woesebacteria bacterium RBG_19FT_COMBO_37_29]
MVVYTKRGDKGKTMLLGSQMLVAKDSPVVNALGAIDEANSYLGVIVADSNDKILKRILLKIQNNLFTINSILAGAKLKLAESNVKDLENIIDKIEPKLPILKNFVIPGGPKISAKLMYARSLIRRAEREVVGISKKLKVKNNIGILAYLNRLSDTLFILARQETYKKGKKETIWHS